MSISPELAVIGVFSKASIKPQTLQYNKNFYPEVEYKELITSAGFQWNIIKPALEELLEIETINSFLIIGDNIFPVIRNIINQYNKSNVFVDDNIILLSRSSALELIKHSYSGTESMEYMINQYLPSKKFPEKRVAFIKNKVKWLEMEKTSAGTLKAVENKRSSLFYIHDIEPSEHPVFLSFFKHCHSRMIGKLNPDSHLFLAIPVMNDLEALKLLLNDLIIETPKVPELALSILVCINSPENTDENDKTLEYLMELQKNNIPFSLGILNLQKGECTSRQGTARRIMFETISSIASLDSLMMALDADCRISSDILKECLKTTDSLFNFKLRFDGDYVKEYEYYDRWFEYCRNFWKVAGSSAWWVRQKCPGITFRTSLYQKVPSASWDLSNAEHLRFLDECKKTGAVLITKDITGLITSTRMDERIPDGMSNDVRNAINKVFIPVPDPEVAMMIKGMLDRKEIILDSYLDQMKLVTMISQKIKYIPLDEGENELQKMFTELS